MEKFMLYKSINIHLLLLYLFRWKYANNNYKIISLIMNEGWLSKIAEIVF